MSLLHRMSVLVLVAALAGCASTAPALPLPEVFLTHFYAVLDQPTYEAMRDSQLMATLAATEVSQVDTGTEVWTGFYVEGRRTYMELFGADHPPPGGKEGDTGLALTVESVGAVQALADRWRSSFGGRVQLTSRQAKLDDGSTVPWFTAVELEPSVPPPAMETWVMEIDPGYLAVRHPGSGPITDPLSRERYQSWKYRSELPFEDVVAIRTALAPAEMAELETQLRAAHWRIERRGDGFAAHGTEFDLDVVPVTRKPGLQSITLRLRRSVAAQTVTLGKAQLRIDGLQAQLAFWQ